MEKFIKGALWVCQEKCVSFIKFSYRQFSKLPVLHGRINTAHI